MHTRAAEPTPSVGTAAREVAEHASTLARLELELAGLELKRKAGALGVGAGLGIAAGLTALYALGFLFAAVAVALSIVLDAWLALLLVGVGLLALAALLGLSAVRKIKRGTPPLPEQAIAEAKLTTAALKGNGDGRA